MNETEYYIPLTINELINGLKSIVEESKDLTGQEYITDIMVTNEKDDRDVPPGSIAIFLRQNTLDPNEPRYGTVVVTPNKATRFM